VTANYKWQDKVVLVVEDDVSSQILLSAILKRTGARILVATDGESAVNLVKSNSNIDLILMDIKLMGISGLEATKLIKQIYPDTPVIAQTACAIAGDMEKCLDAGCNAYLTKPINTKVLLETIDYYFRRNITRELLDLEVYSN
jgi:CheY-like chemotaxis protein